MVFTFSTGDSGVVSVLPLGRLKGEKPQEQPVIMWCHNTTVTLGIGVCNSLISEC